MGVPEVGIGVVEVGVGAMMVVEGLGGREDSDRLLTLRLDLLSCKLRPTILFVILMPASFFLCRTHLRLSCIRFCLSCKYPPNG